MTATSEDDELLSILLVNLRNVAATFGEGTPPYETVRTTLEEHLQAMKAKGSSTNIAATRGTQQQNYAASAEQGELADMFANLAFRPKPT